MKKKTIKKTPSKRVINKTKIKNTNLNSNSTITEKLKREVFPYIVEDIIKALHSAQVGQSIRLGKLGHIKKTRRQGSINGNDYDVYSYRFKAFSALKNH